jgi:Cu(I)/Ag(I) efflux system membrane fusion protein
MKAQLLTILGVAVLAVAAATACGDDEGSISATDDESGAVSGMKGMDGMAMDMDTEGGTIRLTREQMRTFGVTFDTIAVRSLDRTIRAVGLVDFDETRMAYVAPKFGGFVERLHVDFEGKPVSRGQPLLEIYSPELVSAQEELLLARRLDERVGASGVEGVSGGSARLFDSARRRLRYWDISEAQIERVLRTGEVQKTMTLHSPVSGIVMEKSVFEGQAVNPGESLYMIADLSRVWVEAELFEADAALVHAGMRATITVAALPGRSFSGVIEYVYPTLQEETRSMQARIALANPGGLLKPGMYATVRLERALGNVLSVPRSAVLQTGENAIAFVDMGSGRLMPHELTLGVAGTDHVEIVAGLELGQRVVTSAQYLLDSESNLAEVMRAMMAQMNLSDMDAMDMGGPPVGSRDTTGMEMDMPGMDEEN